MTPHDTPPPAIARQREAFRAMTPAQRVEAAAEMSEDVRALAMAGIRHRHPGLTDGAVHEALLKLLYGTASPAGEPEPKTGQA